MKAAKLFFILLCLAALAAPAAAAGGAGTAANPYIIETAAELQSIQNNLAAHYRLANDIDLSGVTWTSIGGSGRGVFIGSLDGNNHIISNLVLSSDGGYNGLFGVVGGSATIKNIILKNCKHTARGADSALLIGSIYGATNQLIISNCHIYSSIMINNGGYSGLLLGGAGGGSLVSISDCGVYDSIFISDGHHIGLLQGAIASGAQETISNIVIRNCIISGGSNVGGCIASVYAYNSNQIGSLIASNILVENCLIQATGRAGGILGYHNPTYSEFTLTDSTVKDTSILGATSGGLAS